MPIRPIKKISGKRIRFPMPDERYRFTKDEVATLRGRLNVAVLADDRYFRVQNPIVPNRLDQRIGATLAGVYLGLISEYAPPSLLRQVYGAAWAAHNNSIALGKSEAEARNCAILIVQLPLEKFFRVGPTGYMLDPQRLDFLCEHYKLRPKAKGRT